MHEPPARTPRSTAGCWACFAVLAAVACPAIARAQAVAARDSSPPVVGAAPSCHRTPGSWQGAYDVVSQSLAAMDTAIVRPTELIALNRRIADAVRATLGGSDTLPPRADTLDRTEVDGTLPLVIVVHRDAPATWRLDAGADSAATKLANFYALVLGTMAPNALWISWPTGATRDAAEIRVHLRTQTFGGLGADASRDDAPRVFRVLHPSDPAGMPVLARSGPFSPSSRVMNSGIAFRVVMQATVDADGNVEKGSVHDIRSLASASDSAHFDDYYKKVVDAARESMLHSKYVPAYRDGCAQPQVVQRSFSVNPGARR